MRLFQAHHYFQGLTPYRVLIILIWSLTPILYYFRIMWMRLPIVGSFSEHLIPTIIVISILAALKDCLRRLSPIPIVIYLAFVAVYLFDYVFYPMNNQYMDEEGINFLLYSLPLLFIGATINIKESWDDLYAVSFLSIIAFGLFKALLNYVGFESDTLQKGDMNGAYQLLPHLLFCIWGLFRKVNIWRIIIVLYGVFLLLGQGNRGSVLSLLVFVILFAFFVFKGKSAFKIRTSLLLFSIVIYLFLDSIMLFLFDIMQDFGFSVRLFDKYINGGIEDSSGRDALYNIAAEAISNSPILGYGLFADRRICGNGYVHNFILEILIDFGPILGVLFIGLLFFRYIKVTLKLDDMNKPFSFLLLCNGIVPLLFSRSYLTSMFFFFLIGFITNRKLIQENK